LRGNVVSTLWYCEIMSGTLPDGAGGILRKRKGMGYNAQICTKLHIEHGS
jgi:hypothetical protein